MDFVRELTADEIVGALEKGKAKADLILAQAERDPSSLERNYKIVLNAVDHAEDNFSLEGYAHRNDIYSEKEDKISEGSLRKLFLSAVEAVECLEDIEPEVQKLAPGPSSMVTGCGTDRHIKLIKAANVFRTDGKSDEPAYDIQRIIQAYRGASPGIAAQ